jgi:hypothetical protein
MANKHSVWQERLRYEDKAATQFLNPNRLANIESLLESLQRFEARLKTRPNYPPKLKSSSTSAVSKFNRTSASPGGSRGKYSGSNTSLTTAPTHASNPHLAMGHSPSPLTRPSTAELARKSMIKCASLSDGFQRAVNLLAEEDLNPLQRRCALVSRLSTASGLRKAYKSSPYLQKLPRKKQRRIGCCKHVLLSRFN